MSESNTPPNQPNEGAVPPPEDHPVETPGEQPAGTPAEPATPAASGEVPPAAGATPPAAGDGTVPPPSAQPYGEQPHGEQPYGDPAAPPPAPKKSRTGLIVGLVAGLLVLAIVAVLVIVLVVNKGDDKHSIATPASAGGMKRDSTQEKALGQQLDSAEQQFKTQAKSVSYVKSAVYKQSDSKRGPAGGLVFLGAKLTKPQSPTAFVDAFSKQASQNGFKVTKVSPGDGGGKAVCAAQEANSQKVAICAWATKDSMGELIPTVPGWDSAKLATVLRDLRADVEKSE